jgi:gamma-glutamyltranspeptidase/glutathione hydrolase
VKDQPGFSAQFLSPDGRVPKAGAVQRNTALADTLETLAREGLDSFYRGSVGQAVAADLKDAGCPVTAEDLARHRSVRRRPLALALDNAVVHGTPPPTQGLTTLMLLGLFQRAGVKSAEGAEFIHAMVEASKIAYRVRDDKICDPRFMGVHDQCQPRRSLAPPIHRWGHHLDGSGRWRRPRRQLYPERLSSLRIRCRPEEYGHPLA